MVEKNPITPEGAQKLRDELYRRKTVDRPQISQMIAEARAHGDLSENAEYHAARERGGFNEGRIKELEDKLARAEVIDPTKLSGDRGDPVDVTVRTVASECVSIGDSPALCTASMNFADVPKSVTPARSARSNNRRPSG